MQSKEYINCPVHSQFAAGGRGWYNSPWIMVDLHCHILPGMDDGAADLGAALKMARLASEDGVRAICATPHAGVNPYRNSKDEIIGSVKQLQAKIDEAGVAIKLFAGSEVPVTADIAMMAEEDELVTLGDSSYILVELPFYGDLSGARGQIFELSIAGLRVVLAHPERAQALQHAPDLLEDLRYAGCRTQINAGSIRGTEGRKVRGMCRRWLKDGLVDVIASDAHSPDRRRPALSPIREEVVELCGEDMWRRMTVVNPARILMDRNTK
jgi:protein-tyrosine phosphatase